MATTYEQPELAQGIQGILDGVRRRIRAYVFAEGMAILLLWCGITFWIGLAIDYFPILVWASELPWGVRAFGLSAIGGVAAAIVYWFILRRVFVRLPDASMAIILERRFGHFRDGLVTAVEMRPGAQGVDADMLAASARHAAEAADDVSIGRVFDLPPLIWKWVGCAILLAPIGAFGSYAPDSMKVWVDRMYRLKDTPWPRSAEIEMVGVETVRPTSAWSEILPTAPVAFRDKVVKGAKGANLKIRVKANAEAAVIPDYCTIYYRAKDGGRGYVNMPKSGSLDDKQQVYAFDGKPFRGVLSELRMDIVGFDHRLRNYRIEVVAPPTVVATNLACTFPSYLQDSETSAWSPREIEYKSTGVKLPKGTRVDVQCRTNKPLQAAFAVRLESGETVQTELIEPTVFSIPIVIDKDAVTLEIMLQDADEIVSEQPLKISIQTIHDQPPKVDVRLSGIGAAVTPDFVAPVEGVIVDDFEVARAWFDVTRGEDPKRKYPLKVEGNGDVNDRLDFRLLRSENGGLRISPGDKLRLVIQAVDQYDLEGADPNQGANDGVLLDVVTSTELLAILERRELSLRRRYKQIIEETTQLRDMMLVIRSGYKKKDDGEAGADPRDAGADPGDSEGKTPEELLERRRIRVRHGISQSQKLAQEVLGVSLSFSDIREELVNNRVDTEDRKQRIVEQIEQPLVAISEKEYPKLDIILEQLEKDYQDPASNASADAAVAQANLILIQLNQVLEAMADIESFNELMELVRGMIQEQEDLIKKTDKKRKSDFFD